MKYIVDKYVHIVTVPRRATVWADASGTREGSLQFMADVLALTPERGGAITSLTALAPAPIQWAVPLTAKQRAALPNPRIPWPVSGSDGTMPQPRTRLFFPILQELTCYKAVHVAQQVCSDVLLLLLLLR